MTSEWHKTACNLCYVNCALEIAVEDGRMTKVRGDKAGPKSAGYLCNKASRIPYYAHHRDRLTTPLRRGADGAFEAIAWDTAIAEIAARIKDIHAAHGGGAFALYGGGGQGNHAGGGNALALLRALGSRAQFNALSQEKTGDFWINGQMFGSQVCHTAEDVHHCDLLLVIGANPWVAHGFPNAREQLNAIRKDPGRRLIVIDPRRTETAAMADLHLALRPGADAFLLAAILALLVRRDAIDHAFVAAHTAGFETVRDALADVPAEAWAAAAEVPMADVERCVDMIVAAGAMTVRVELGIQQGLNSTLNSYLEKLLIMLTGSFGRRGTNQLHTWLVPLWGNSIGARYAPTGDEVIGGLLPPNSFPAAVLSDHPDRLRAVLVDSSNPANTAADTVAVEQALAALDLLVVVDVAMTETARLADYVLPASSTYEKTEFTLFNFEFPTNYFHVRAPLLPALPGTLPEPEIYSRLARALDLLPGDTELAPLREAARRSRAGFAEAFAAALAEDPSLRTLAPILLYETLGQALPGRLAAAALLWPAARACARRMPDAVRNALSLGPEVADAELGDRLFDAVVGTREGIALTAHDYDDVWSLVEHADKRVHLAIPMMLDWLAVLDPAQLGATTGYPFVLAAGQRRMYNANQIFRDPAWRRADPDGALLVHPGDLAELGVGDGEWIVVRSAGGRMVVRSQADPAMRRGLLALPHGYGQAYPAADGVRLTNGPRINLLTAGADRDPIAGTPYHKHVAVQLERPTSQEAVAAEAVSRRIHAGASTTAAISSIKRL